MHGKLRANHYVHPAVPVHVKAGLKYINPHSIDNMYRKAISGIDNSHIEEFQSSSGS